MDQKRLAAAQQGDKTYEGTECPKCGTTTKYTTSGQCRQCATERAKQDSRKRTALLKSLMAQAKA